MDDPKDEIKQDLGNSSGFSPNISASTRRLSKVPIHSTVDTSLFHQAAKAIDRQKAMYKAEVKGYGWYEWMGVFLPCLRWLKTYDVKTLLMWDIMAGLSVGAMVIPQGMSYANLAGLPQVYGLYGSFVPCLVYSLLGSSKQLSVGPVAVTSILLGNGLESLFGIQSPCNYVVGAAPPPPPPVTNTTTEPTCDDFSRAAIQVAFLAGVLYTVIGLLGLGWLTYFLSHATISGFMSGAAILIAMSQVKYILGISIARADNLQDNLKEIFHGLDQFSWQEFSMGMSFILILLIIRVLSRRIKKLKILRALGPLFVCVLSIALMNIFKWYNPPGDPAIQNIGKIPQGVNTYIYSAVM